MIYAKDPTTLLYIYPLLLTQTPPQVPRKQNIKATYSFTDETFSLIRNLILSALGTIYFTIGKKRAR